VGRPVHVLARAICFRAYHLSLLCVAQKRQNPEDVLGFLEHGRVGQLVVVGTYVPVWCFVASGGSDRRTKHCVVESSLAGRIVA
jgi:hypothetical protein